MWRAALDKSGVRGTGRLAGGINRSLQPDAPLHWAIMYRVEAEKELGLDREMS